MRVPNNLIPTYNMSLHTLRLRIEPIQTHKFFKKFPSYFLITLSIHFRSMGLFVTIGFDCIIVKICFFKQYKLVFCCEAAISSTTAEELTYKYGNGLPRGPFE